MSSQPRAGFRLPRGGPALFALVMLASLVVGMACAIGAAVLTGVGWSAVAAGALTASLAMAAAVLIVVWWWRRLDEAAREAHKWAWFWGGNVGLAVAAAAFLTLIRMDLDASDLAAYGPADMIALGIALTLFLQLIGYTLAWAGWWLARR